MGETRPAKASLTERAVNTIRNSILELTLPPGGRIDDKVLMSRFQLSRTQAREALNRLAAEGLVKIEANKGAFVLPLDLVGVAQFFDAYHVAERLIAHFCDFADGGLLEDLEEVHRRHSAAVRNNEFLEICRLNAAFHTRIAQASGNEYVLNFSARLHNHAQRLSFLVYRMEQRQERGLKEQQEYIVAEHDQIVEAVRRRDRDLLGRVMAAHAKRFQDRISRIIAEGRGLDSSLA